jgi:CPA2 family monovalent cation:H+ antiporter-2
MGAASLVLDLLFVYAIGLFVVVVLARLRVPTIVALVVAGVAAGPSGLGIVTDPQRIDTLAELGIDLLLFTVGIEFSLSHARKVWRSLVGAGVLQMSATALLTTALLLLTRQFATHTAVFLGVFVAMSSTAVTLRGLADRNEIDAPHGRLAVGVLLFQDLAVVVVLMLVPVLAGQVASSAIPGLLLRAGGALAAVGIIGRLLLPPLIRIAIRSRRHEVFPFALLVASVGTAHLCAVLGLPTAVGAFFAGLVLAESEFSHQALAEMRPLRDLLASLFFMSLGMIVDLPAMAAGIVILPLVVGGLVLLKAAVATGAFLAVREPARVAVMGGLALAQVGEFSLLFGQAGLGAGLVDAGTWQTLLAAAMLTMVITPVLLAVAPAAGARVASLVRGRGGLETPGEEPGEARVVVLGYGLGGQLLGAALRTAERPYLVMELNGAAVLRARREGVPIVYGDATNPDALRSAGVARAAAVAIVLNDPEAAGRAVGLIRNLSPTVPIVVRTRYRLGAERLQAAGATTVVVEEIETSLEVLGQLLARLGTPGNRIEAILDTLRHEAIVRPLRAPETPLGELPVLLREAGIATDEIGVGDWAAGRTIAETALRRATGASIVAVGRGDAYTTSPSPEQRLAATDIVYLIGTREAVDRARRLLRAGPDAG